MATQWSSDADRVEDIRRKIDGPHGLAYVSGGDARFLLSVVDRFTCGNATPQTYGMPNPGRLAHLPSEVDILHRRCERTEWMVRELSRAVSDMLDMLVFRHQGDGRSVLTFNDADAEKARSINDRIGLIATD